MTISKKVRACAFGALVAGAALIAATLGPVQRAVSQGMVQINSLVGTEQISLNYPCTVSCFVNSATLANYSQSQPGGNAENAIIGGDAGTNLFQRATTGSSVTTAVTYGGPDRFAYWSGTATAMTVSKTTTAGDLPAGLTFNAGFKMARTSGQTGVVQVCMMQVVESVNAYAFSGATAEIDFHATAGATFTGANSGMTAYLISGTAADEGAVNAAFGLNAGGGGGAGWTGQVNTGVAVTISTTNTRYSVVAPVPSGAKEVAVALCWTPVGTASTNDYIAFAGIQLTRNASLTSVAGSAGAVLSANDTRAKSFARRTQALETAMQQRYAYAINEASITAGAIAVGGGTALGTSTTCSANVRFPQTMRVAPSYANALSAATFKLVSASQAATALSTPFSATLVANSVDSASINFTTTGMTAKDSCELVSAAGVGQMLWTAEL